jgi:hypothetical protein
MSARVHVVQSKKVGYNHVSIRAGVCVARMPADGQMPFRRNKSVRTGARRRRVETIFKFDQYWQHYLTQGRQRLRFHPL